jgi:S-formylglutathione hydrolase FrmB
MASHPLRALAGLVVAVAAGIVPAPDASAATYRPASDGAAIVGTTKVDAHTYDLTVRTPAIGDTEKMRVMLPKGWSRTAKRTWPVVYAYQGGNDDYLSWIRGSQIATLAAQYDTIVVLPSGGAYGGYADWYNYGKGGTPKWETFHTSEVMQLIERNFRADKRRAAVGVSSGAQGAITYAARHPGMYRYAASFSGILHLTEAGLPAVLMFQGLTYKFDPFRIWGVPIVDEKNWEAHDPYVLAANLRGTGLYVSSGLTGLPGPYDPDPNDLQADLYGAIGEALVGSTASAFVNKVMALRIPITTHLYVGGWHNWKYWRPELNTAWPLMMKALGAKKVA